MKIEHVAMWVKDLERQKDFYVKYFKATFGEKYINPVKNFSSYFLTFNSGARLELMAIPGVADAAYPAYGYAHIAFSTGSEEAVDSLTQFFKSEGIPVIDGPRKTGDGYYESVILDPEGNRIEITV